MRKLLILTTPFVVLAVAFLVIKNSTPQNESEHLSVSFTSYVTQIKGVKKIQLVEMTSVEQIQRTSEFSMFWDLLKLPDLVVLARVPTTYTYSINLEEPFKVIRENNKIVIYAPELKAGVPAADISGISYEVKKGGMLRDSRAAFDDLRSSLTPLLNERAKLNQPLALKEAKTQLKQLAQGWLPQAGDEIEVIFANEGPIRANP